MEKHALDKRLPYLRAQLWDYFTKTGLTLTLEEIPVEDFVKAFKLDANPRWQIRMTLQMPVLVICRGKKIFKIPQSDGHTVTITDYILRLRKFDSLEDGAL